MLASEMIIKNSDVLKLLKHYKFNISYQSGDMIRSNCMLHDGNNPSAFVINVDTTLWFCHTGSCGGGDIFTLVEKMEKIGFAQAVYWLADFYDLSITDLELTERKDANSKELQQFIKAMSKRKKKLIDEYLLPNNIKAIAKYRNFKKETLNTFGIGFYSEVDLVKKDGEPYKIYKRVAFPIQFNNKCIGISLRRTKSTDYPKWSHQPVGLETANILYNYDVAKEFNVITIVEGIVDVLAYHEIGVPAVATFGSNVSDKQYRLLLKTGADLVFSYDGDKAGRDGNTKSIKLFKNKVNMTVVPFSEGQDPANITREELLALYEGRRCC